MNAGKCVKCVYWKRLSWSGYSPPACHFLLEKHRARRRDADGGCMEFQKNTCKSKHTGYTLSSEEFS